MTSSQLESWFDPVVTMEVKKELDNMGHGV